MSEPLLEMTDVVMEFGLSSRSFGRSRTSITAVNHVDLHIAGGETLGLVGESGCGKSTLGRIATGLTPPTSGSVRYAGREVSRSGRHPSGVQMIFQDPYSSLNPRMPVRSIIDEPLVLNGHGSRHTRWGRTSELLDLVGLPASYGERYPHELSGGQRQRAAIARALALNPRLVVCDEPVSALDVSIQAQILNLLKDLQEQMSLSYLFIAHGIQAVSYVSDRIAVMYLGEIVELGTARQVFGEPLHPYTASLRSAIPLPDPKLRDRERIVLKGDLPSNTALPTGCPFHTRCPSRMPQCSVVKPQLRTHEGGRTVACLLHEPDLGLGAVPRADLPDLTSQNAELPR